MTKQIEAVPLFDEVIGLDVGSNTHTSVFGTEAAGTFKKSSTQSTAEVSGQKSDYLILTTQSWSHSYVSRGVPTIPYGTGDLISTRLDGQ